MAKEKISLEVDEKFIQNLFGLANLPSPEEITLEELNSVVVAIRKKMDQAIMAQTTSSASKMASKTSRFDDDDDDEEAGKEFLKGGEVDAAKQRQRSILIVDDLGIIIHQLEILFKKLGFEVTTSKELYDAINQYKKKDFGYVIMDLFLPTEREGFMLLDEVKKLSLFCKLNTRIIVMSTSPKSEYKEKCINRGAEFYVEKSIGWQKNVIEFCLGKGSKND